MSLNTKMDSRSEYKIKRDIMKIQNGQRDNLGDDDLIQRFSKYANKFLFMNADPFIKKKY